MGHCGLGTICNPRPWSHADLPIQTLWSEFRTPGPRRRRELWSGCAPLGRAGQARAEISGVRLPRGCPVSWEGAELAVINFTSVLHRGEKTFPLLSFLLWPASLMALRTLPRL